MLLYNLFSVERLMLWTLRAMNIILLAIFWKTPEGGKGNFFPFLSHKIKFSADWEITFQKLSDLILQFKLKWSISFKNIWDCINCAFSNIIELLFQLYEDIWTWNTKQFVKIYVQEIHNNNVKTHQNYNGCTCSSYEGAIWKGIQQCFLCSFWQVMMG